MTGWHPRVLGLECNNITILPSYAKPLMWWWSYEWPQLITWQPFFTRRCAQESVWDQFSGYHNPRSLLVVIEWLVGIQVCLECNNILFCHHMPRWWSYEWPQLNTWQPFFTRRCVPRNLSSEINFQANPRSLLDVIEWLVGIQVCLECNNILWTSYAKPLMWW